MRAVMQCASLLVRARALLQLLTELVSCCSRFHVAVCVCVCVRVCVCHVGVGVQVGAGVEPACTYIEIVCVHKFADVQRLFFLYS
jgi:hypothetical protein